MCEGPIASAQFKLDATNADRIEGALLLKAWIVLLQGLDSFYASFMNLKHKQSLQEN